MSSWTRTDRSAFPWYLTGTEGPNPGSRRTHSRPVRVPSLACAGVARPQGGSGTALTDGTGQEATSKWRELGAGTAACLLFLVLQVLRRPEPPAPPAPPAHLCPASSRSASRQAPSGFNAASLRLSTQRLCRESAPRETLSHFVTDGAGPAR